MTQIETRAARASGAPSTLSGKIALVTGAGSGIGRSAALGFAARGATVVLAARREPELRRLANDIEKLGGVAEVLPTDLRHADAAERLVAAITAKFGRLDIAFNNAGISSYGPIEQLGLADFDQVMSVNLRGVWLLLKHEIAAMRAAGHGGAIVNTSSIAAMGGTAGLSIYAASKAGVEAMTRVLALETGPDGVRINSICPGMTLTPMNEGMPEPMLTAVASHTALKRLAQPEDISDVAVWLCGEEARYVTGQSILVDGGFNIAGLR